jgi:hypothetical protein
MMPIIIFIINKKSMDKTDSLSSFLFFFNLQGNSAEFVAHIHHDQFMNVLPIISCWTLQMSWRMLQPFWIGAWSLSLMNVVRRTSWLITVGLKKNEWERFGLCDLLDFNQSLKFGLIMD